MSRTITIVGAGSIGVGFAVHFASAGYTVRVWDALPEAYGRARAEMESRFTLLSEEGLLTDSVSQVMQRIGFFEILLDALKGADLVQECVPERLDIKRAIFQQVGAYSKPDAVLASSSSAIVSSEFATATPARDRVLIAHPGNPPYLIPVIEIVPSSYTAEETVVRAMDIYRESGLKPVRINREVEGFVFNRLQGAVLREAYCLVRDGVIGVDDLDEVMRSGLGRRWAFIGPFETSDLNTRGGIGSHAQKMGPAYERMGAERGQSDPWTEDLVALVESQRRALLPLEKWDERVAWRDRHLMALKKLLS
jgi:3-hydroxyacyl-CoA dehydrogenase